jgi:rRNA maturation endonuclease Nob1
MIEYKECQNCKKVFKLSKASSSQHYHSCPFCGDWNTAYISKWQYRINRNNCFIHDNILKCP